MRTVESLVVFYQNPEGEVEEIREYSEEDLKGLSVEELVAGLRHVSESGEKENAYYYEEASKALSIYEYANRR